MKWKYRAKPSPIGNMHGIFGDGDELICWLSAPQVQHAPVIEAALDNAEKLQSLKEGMKQVRDTLTKKASLSFGQREKALQEALVLVKGLLSEADISG